MKKATCEHCGIVLNDRLGKNRINCANSGYYYQCNECFSKIYNYHDSPSDSRANTTKNTNVYGFEIELDGYNRDALQTSCKRLEQFGWLPTRDITVQVEMKTPKYYSLNGLAKTLTQLFKELGSVPSDQAGAHINVSDEQLTAQEWVLIRDYYNDIFKPMYDYLRSNPTACKKLFGRTTNNRWCCEFSANEHATTFNMEWKKFKHPRIEIRVARITTVEQYMNSAKFAGVMMSTIRTNFLNHAKWETTTNNESYLCSNGAKGLLANQEKMDAKAKLTGKKLLEKMIKAID